MFTQQYNFKEKASSVPAWMREQEENKKKKQLEKSNQPLSALQVIRKRRATLKTSPSKSDNVVSSEPEPWAYYMKVRPDPNNNFNVTDLPKETFVPPPSPRGKLRD